VLETGSANPISMIAPLASSCSRKSDFLEFVEGGDRLVKLAEIRASGFLSKTARHSDLPSLLKLSLLFVG
jgi:hypothetical protein